MRELKYHEKKLLKKVDFLNVSPNVKRIPVAQSEKEKAIKAFSSPPLIVRFMCVSGSRMETYERLR